MTDTPENVSVLQPAAASSSTPLLLTQIHHPSITTNTHSGLYSTCCTQWPKCVDESDFVGKFRNSCFFDQNM